MDTLPLERLHTMLKMFANAKVTQQELKQFLARNIKEGKLTLSGGVYKLA